MEFFSQDGTPLSNYSDCGLLLFDLKEQDVHSGGSGCGCSAAVLCAHLIPGLLAGRWKRVLFCPTGALLSPTSTQQGESIPGVCHLFALEGEEGVAEINVRIAQLFNIIFDVLRVGGYDVAGKSYQLRVVSLVVGMLICMGVFYKNQKNRPHKRGFMDIFREFNIHSARNNWYLKLTLTVSTAMLIINLLNIPRAMWVGIACMSVCVPFSSDIAPKAKKRAPFNIVGSLIFVALYYALPKWVHPYIGIIGGIGVGYSAGYSWQTVYNTFGALYIASGIFGVKTAVLLRIGANIFATLYTVMFNHVFNNVFAFIKNRKENLITE